MAQFFEFTSSGIKFTGYQDVRQALKDAWETTFGVQLDDSPTSPDGHHIDLEAKTVYSVMEAMQVVTTMLNRSQAVGQFLDILAAFVGISRNEDETDDELRTRLNSASTSGLATYDGMLTYLRDQIHASVNLLRNDEPTQNEDGLPGHSVRAVIPQAVYDALEEKADDGEIDSADNYIAQKMWDCKAAGIRSDGNILPLPVMSTEKVVREPDESRLPKLAQVNGKSITTENQEVVNELSQAFPELAQILPKQLGAVLHACERETTLAELMIALSATSRRTFVRKVLNPILAANLIKHTHPENPRHPQQRYCLTELGLEMLKLLNEDKQ